MTATVEEVTTMLARTLMDFHGLDDWTFLWNDHSKWAGQCFYNAKVITMSREICLDTAARNIQETILHEIAHALCRPDDSHGENWWNTLQVIGGDGIWVMNDGRVTYAGPKREGNE